MSYSYDPVTRRTDVRLNAQTLNRSVVEVSVAQVTEISVTYNTLFRLKLLHVCELNFTHYY